jgi:hypothetical protein
MFRKSRFLVFALGAAAMASMAAQSLRAAESSINPQLLPPRVQQQLASAGSSRMGPGSRVMINPQPLPPKQQNGANGTR